MSVQHFFVFAALFVPLVIDTFIVSATLGLAGLPKKEQPRTTAILAAFEALMPAVGVLIGQGIGNFIGRFAGYVAGIVIGLAGLLMLKSEPAETQEVRRKKMLARTRSVAIINLGFSISIDELAIGLSLGLLHIPLLLAMVIIGVQAFVASWLGFRLGSRLSESLEEHAERLGGFILIAVGIILVIMTLAGHKL